jgi:chemotaxis receptor (MCP) glutamine deamidase CheD
MFANLSVGTSKPIGDQNIAAVERILSIYNIPIVGRDLGGTVGRRIAAHIETGEVEVFFVGKSSQRI